MAVAEFVHSLLVVSEPFAVAYGLDLLNNSMVIDIGAGTIDFCIMHGSIPTEEDQKTILTAGDYIDEQLFSYLNEKYPNSYFNKNMVRKYKEQYSFVGAVKSEIQVEIPVEGKPVMHDITHEIQLLKSYQESIALFKRWKIEKIFWFDRELAIKAAELLNRVTYLKSTFLSWTAQYKLDQGRATFKNSSSYRSLI